jgi:zinc protease
MFQIFLISHAAYVQFQGGSMRTLIMIVFVLLAISIIPIILFAQKNPANNSGSEIDIPYKKFVLANGLTLLVHEDHKAPIVAVNVWYHVGSKNEKDRRTGFAHLFEHLMFNGSENFDDDYFQVLERVGATDLNGTTSEDRTNYFQNVPTSAFDLALWMESDRMGHLVGAISQKKLDEQRGVVQNEKRQGENQPYAISDELITKATWPSEHPYAHTVIGSMEDLNAASLDDVKDWFKTYYGAANAVLVVAGDVDANTALEKVKKYFGDIPSGPPVAHFNSWTAKRTGEQRQIAQDRVPQARIYKVWNVPQWGTAEFQYLKLLTNVLASGKTSRLYKRLVYDDQIATNVNSYLDEREIASQFYIEVTAKPGDDLKKVEAALDEEIAKFMKSGPTEQELKRVKTQYVARFVRGIERIGGFGGKSDILAMNQVFGGSPDFYKTTLNQIQKATVKDLHNAAIQWLSDGVYVLEIYPFPNYSETKTDTVVRKTLPKTGESPEAKFPKLERTVLSNGLKVILAERKSVPVVNFNLLFDAGYAADQFAAPGTANLAMNMMDEGTASRNALQISDELAMLGANLGTGSNLDMSTVSLSALKSNLDGSLAIFADVILNPSFPKEDFDRLQKQTIAGIQREKTQPVQMGLRVLPKLLYGGDHAYSTPLTGSGTEETVAKMKRDDMIKFYQTWIKPNIATMIVVGDITMNDLKPRLEKLFSGWKAGEVPKKNLATVVLPAKSSVYIVDKPGAQQSIIFPANITVQKNNPDAIAIEAMNTILGGAFTSRINMNLREDKHWSYGSGSFVFTARGQQPFIGYGIVQTDKTKESMIELNKELRDILGPRPATSDELSKVQSSMTLELPGSWETNNAVIGSIAEMVRFEYSDDYFETFVKKIKSLNLDNITNAAKIVVHPDNLVWVVVGDRAKIETGIRELGYGEVKLIDSNGNMIK